VRNFQKNRQISSGTFFLLKNNYFSPTSQSCAALYYAWCDVVFFKKHSLEWFKNRFSKFGTNLQQKILFSKNVFFSLYPHPKQKEIFLLNKFLKQNCAQVTKQFFASNCDSAYLFAIKKTT